MPHGLQFVLSPPQDLQLESLARLTLELELALNAIQAHLETMETDINDLQRRVKALEGAKPAPTAVVSAAGGQAPTVAPPEVETSGSIGPDLSRYAAEGHTHSGVNLSDAQTVGGAKTFTAKATFNNEVEIDGDLNHDGTNIGFHGATPVPRDTGWSVTNVTVTRSYDADTVTLAVLADVVGTLIENVLKARGDLGG